METRKDEDSESIYINLEDSKSACHHSEVYENFWPNTETPNPGSEVVSEARQVRSGSPAAVCLGLLCVLLLAVIIGLSVKHKAEREKLQASCDNLTTERDGLQNQLSNIETFCPFGWRKFMSSCYYVSLSSNTWERGRQDCRGKGAHLVIINSREEQIFVSGLATNFWIGLSNQESERSWKWVDSTFLISRYWMPGEPNSGRFLRNNVFIRESCVQVSSSSHDILSNWRDVLCDKLHSWICEKKTQSVFT